MHGWGINKTKEQERQDIEILNSVNHVVSVSKSSENLLLEKEILNKKKNIVIGFGITSKNIASFKKADGCVVGSEICKKISKSIKNRQNPVTNVSNMVKKLKAKII